MQGLRLAVEALVDVADGFPVRQVLDFGLQRGQAVLDQAGFFFRLVFQRGDAAGVGLVFGQYPDVDADADGEAGLNDVKDEFP